MEIILLAALVIILAGVYLQLAHMRRSHNKDWKEYGHRHTFTAENGVYTDLESGRVFDMKEARK
jgi:hypothetical protein